MPTRERRLRAQPKMRPLTPQELGVLKSKLRTMNLSHEAAACAFGVSASMLTAALEGRRIQYAKRFALLGEECS